MREEESLLICCKAFQQECENRFSNITIRKIPSLLLGKCEFGKDDYSLNIINLPEELRPIPEESESAPDPEEEGTSPSKTIKSSSPTQQNLF
jgi:adenine-specific DNA-methyltransferase